jgi:hypothetical protein
MKWLSLVACALDSNAVGEIINTSLVDCARGGDAIVAAAPRVGVARGGVWGTFFFSRGADFPPGRSKKRDTPSGIALCSPKERPRWIRGADAEKTLPTTRSLNAH